MRDLARVLQKVDENTLTHRPFRSRFQFFSAGVSHQHLAVAKRPARAERWQEARGRYGRWFRSSRLDKVVCETLWVWRRLLEYQGATQRTLMKAAAKPRKFAGPFRKAWPNSPTRTLASRGTQRFLEEIYSGAYVERISRPAGELSSRLSRFLRLPCGSSTISLRTTRAAGAVTISSIRYVSWVFR